MGSPLSPVIANFYMEKFEEHVMETAPLKPKIWYRYVDDTFVIWSHGEEELKKFLQHLNSINENIRFTMEKENDGKLAFLDVLVMRKDQRLGHKVYRKATHTDLYLNRDSNHHPSQKLGIIKTLTERARTICQPEHLKEEMEFLKKAFLSNGYSLKEIRRGSQAKKKKEENTESTVKDTKAFLQYIPNITDRIGKILKRHRIQTVYKPTRKLQYSLRSVKDERDPKTSGGVYRIPCSCGDVYIGTTKRSINTRIKEHERHCRLGQIEKSSVAEHAAIHSEHNIKFDDTAVLCNTQHYYTRLHREAIEIYKHKNSFNKKEEGLKINKSWYPALTRCKIKADSTKSYEDNHVDQSDQSSPRAGQSGSSSARAPRYLRSNRTGAQSVCSESRSS